MSNLFPFSGSPVGFALHTLGELLDDDKDDFFEDRPRQSAKKFKSSHKKRQKYRKSRR